MSTHTHWGQKKFFIKISVLLLNKWEIKAKIRNDSEVKVNLFETNENKRSPIK